MILLTFRPPWYVYVLAAIVALMTMLPDREAEVLLEPENELFYMQLSVHPTPRTYEGD